MIELFKSIGLKSDPFTTSPNVEKFYPATEHRQCLEGLELSVRLRRGLSVIRGGIGVGKTTVSRKLIEIFSDESDTYEFHLIHDPKFETELIFLKHIIDLFGIKKKGDDVQSCRNIVENYLFKAGVEDGRVIVLIVDEGQNLPEQMIDVFRTLLNFETDEYKLLQLIIFGQPEMTKMLSNYPNFEDRIAFNFELGPVSLEDTRGLIDYRIKISGEENQAWFSDGAIKEIHSITDGFPSKMTQLCHQLLLSMIGEERDSIDADMVKRVSSGQTPDADKLKKISSDGEFDDIAVNKLLDVLRKKDKKNSSAESSDKKVEKLAPEANGFYYKPCLNPIEIEGFFKVKDLEILSFQQDHGFGESTGFRIKNFAYSSDVFNISPDVFDKLKNLDLWIVDCLRFKPHKSHAHFDKVMEWISIIKPKKTIFLSAD